MAIGKGSIARAAKATGKPAAKKEAVKPTVKKASKPAAKKELKTPKAQTQGCVFCAIGDDMPICYY